jgi:hypothetical protein
MKMDNLNLPAFPVPGAYAMDKNGNMTIPMNGFTKLEHASLLIVQGMLSNSIDCNQGVEPWWHGTKHKLAKEAVLLAKIILEEANK